MTKEHKVSGLLTIVTDFNEEDDKWDSVLLIGNKEVNLRGWGNSPQEATKNLNHYIDCVHRDIEKYLDQNEPRSEVCTIL